LAPCPTAFFIFTSSVANVSAKLLQTVEAKVYSEACITNFAKFFVCCSDKDGSYSETEALVNVAVASDGKKVGV